MATWTYGDWTTYSDITARRDRLALHMQELNEALMPSTSGAATSFDAGVIERRLAQLQKTFDMLDDQVRRLGSGPILQPALRRPIA